VEPIAADECLFMGLIAKERERERESEL